MDQDIRYARLGDSQIAYQVEGDGPVDLVGSLGSFSTTDATWALPEALAPWIRLSTRCRLIVFDRLGTGSSDPVPLDSLPPLESRWAEIAAVMDAVGSRRAVLFGQQDGGPPAMFGAATAPERVAGLILFHSPARYRWAEDYPYGMDDDTVEEWRALMSSWDTDAMLNMSFPSRADDERFLVWGRRYMRALAGPSALMAYMAEMMSTDVRSLLPSIRVPTLVLHRRDYVWTSAELDRYVADQIPGAVFEEVPGADASLFFAESELMLASIYRFLEKIDPETAGRVRPAERSMATVLFTDIVSSTEQAVSSGDSQWARLLELHDQIANDVVTRHGGRVVKTTGDGVLAIFDGPGRGLIAAVDLRSALAAIGLQIRVGVHTGEIETRGTDVAGIGVHIAARVMAQAAPGEILASRTVRDLVFGSQFAFEDKGAHSLKGIEGQWDLLALQAR